MEDKRNEHLKVQELMQCYANNDPLKEMSDIAGDQDKDEAALKWLALAIIHGVNAGAKKISLSVDDGGEVEVTAKYRKALLPSPGEDLGPRIVKAVRAITHIDGGKGKSPLAVGMGNDNLTLTVKVEKDSDEEEVTLKFP